MTDAHFSAAPPPRVDMVGVGRPFRDDSPEPIRDPELRLPIAVTPDRLQAMAITEGGDVVLVANPASEGTKATWGFPVVLLQPGESPVSDTDKYRATILAQCALTGISRGRAAKVQVGSSGVLPFRFPSKYATTMVHTARQDVSSAEIKSNPDIKIFTPAEVVAMIKRGEVDASAAAEILRELLSRDPGDFGRTPTHEVIKEVGDKLSDHFRENTSRPFVRATRHDIVGDEPELEWVTVVDGKVVQSPMVKMIGLDGYTAVLAVETSPARGANAPGIFGIRNFIPFINAAGGSVKRGKSALETGEQEIAEEIQQVVVPGTATHLIAGIEQLPGVIAGAPVDVFVGQIDHKLTEALRIVQKQKAGEKLTIVEWVKLCRVPKERQDWLRAIEGDEQEELEYVELLKLDLRDVLGVVQSLTDAVTATGLLLLAYEARQREKAREKDVLARLKLGWMAQAAS